MAQGIITDTGAIDNGLGLECSGIVSEVGAGVDGFKAGDRVGALTCGAFSTSHVVPQSLCFRMPDGMSFDEAASIPVVYATVIYGMLDLARLESGMVCGPEGYSWSVSSC